jgi:hypothetical protein
MASHASLDEDVFIDVGARIAGMSSNDKGLPGTGGGGARIAGISSEDALRLNSRIIEGGARIAGMSSDDGGAARRGSRMIGVVNIGGSSSIVPRRTLSPPNVGERMGGMSSSRGAEKSGRNVGGGC